MKGMTIKTIIFDQWKVITDHDNGVMYRNLSGFSPMDEGSFRRQVKNSNLFERFDRGVIEPKEFWRRLSSLTGMNLNYEKFKKVFCLHLDRKEAMERLVKKLEKKYELFILSSTNKLHQEWSEKNCPIMNSFDEKVLSFKLGSRKPETEIFEAALEKTESEPEECIYTDDIEVYVKVAETLGMRGIVFKNREQFTEEIEGLGVKLRAH